MKVGIDVSSMNNLNKGRGIGFYTEHLIESLKKYTDVEVEVIERGEGERGKGKVDIIHYPFFDFFRPTLKVDSKIPTVVTIHDVIPLIFPAHYPPGIKGRINLYRQKQALKKVKAIITDSDSSTEDVKTVFGNKNGNVFTVYLAQGEQFRKLSKADIAKKIKKYNLPDKYILYTGGVNWNKNLLNQAEAAINSGVDVVFVGGGFEKRENLGHPEMKSFKTFLSYYSNNPKVHILGFVSNEDLVALTNGAQLLLFVSYYEGFGLPILEAQACGTPVVTGNISSMVEVAGEGALLMDPHSPLDIGSGIEMALNEDYREKLVQKGFENVKRFSWEKTAQETVQVYKYALSQN